MRAPDVNPVKSNRSSGAWDEGILPYIILVPGGTYA
jgi:hypothetical protein